MKKFALEFILLLSLFSILVPLSKVNIVKAESTIYIRSDGSVEGTDKIQRDGNVYTFTSNISIDYGDCGIEVDRDNIVIDGAGFTLQGTAAYIFRGIDLSGRSNVTIKNMEIRNFMDGIFLVPSSNNTITGNYIMANTDSGIWTAGVSNNITGNYIANNNIGILFEGSHDLIYHNNFINNTKQVEDICWTNPWLPSSANILDDGYPSGGNYWSDYEDRYPNATELDGSGIWNTPYIMDENNQDNYPLLYRYGCIRNLDTNLTYLTIQSAIDAPETLDGHTIFVEEGIYRENLVVNKSLSLIGEDRDNTILNGTDVFVPSIDVEVDSVTIKGFTLEGWSVPNIFINGTTNVTINENRILFIGVGVEMVNSSNNVISGNIIEGDGLDNTGILVVESSGCIIENNTISGAVYDGIRLIWSADNNIITSNTISNNDYGIHIIHSNSNTINNNMIVDNSNGIYIGSGNGTTIVGNTLSDNWAAISFSHSSYDNVICHNNFFNNTHQIGNPIHSAPLSSNRWDNGLEGNYWSDYTGQDANSDGIGDTPYIADGDNYPLMGMFYDFRFWDVNIVISNSTIRQFSAGYHMNSTTGTWEECIMFHVLGTEGTVGFCRVMIPREFMESPYTVLVNNEKVNATELSASNNTHVFLYFTYTHSGIVMIILEFPTLTSILLILIVLTVAIAIYKRRLSET